MEILRYPFIYWKTNSKKIFAHLIGTEYQVAADTIKKVKTMFSDKVSKLSSIYSIPLLSKVQMKTVKVKVRPSYKEKEGTFPVYQAFTLPVVAVYGENDQGFYECFLPFLNEDFFFYKMDQLIPLITHFSQNKFKSLPPEKLHRYIMLDAPKLDEITVRIKDDRFTKNQNEDYAKLAPTLTGIAEKFPYPKNIRRKIKIFPDVAWEQTEKVREVMDKIHKENANLLIVGNHGTGKTAVLTEALQKLHTLTRGKKSKRTFWKTSAHRIIAGAKYLGEWEEICDEMVSDIERVKGVLWVSDFVDLARIGGDGPEDSVAAFLVSYIQHNKLQIISEVTPKELDRARNLLPGFSEHFQTLYIEEMEQKKLFKVFKQFQEYTKENMKIVFEQKAIELSYRLLKRFIKYENFPGKAMHFLSDCLNNAYLKQIKEVTTKDVLDHFVEKTGIAELFLRDDILLNKKEMRAFFEGKIIGQPQAIDDICKVVTVFKAGLNDPEKPIATMLFAGPTGVGKTATVKALASYFFGQGQKKLPLIRLDMSEFSTSAHIYRLIGDGNKEPGKLIQDIRENPFSILLLDEIEKADHSIFDALLTILDEGILVDAYGRITDFRNTIIIMTSNLGTHTKSSVGFEQNTSPHYDASIKAFFRPEFYNRLDVITLFKALSEDIIRKIAEKELKEIEQREGFSKNNIKIVFTEQLVNYIARKGFDEKYGARPLQRTIEKLVISKLAKYILQTKNIHACTIQIDYKDTILLKKI